MKRNIYFSVMALAMTALGAISCSNEEGLLPDIQTGEKTHMSVSVSMEELDAETRSTMTDENGSLKFAWKKGDKLLVTGVNGNNFEHLGVLTLDENSDGQETGIFNGDDITILGKTATYHYFYLGNGTYKNGDTEYIANIPASELTDVSLGNNDIMKASAEMSYGGDGLSGKVSLKRAFGFLTLTVNLPSNVTAPTGGTTLTLSGTGITSKAKIDLTNADAAVTNQGTTSNAVTLTIPAGQSSKKFYLNILPGTLSNLTVTTDINGETYSATVLKDASKTTVANKNYKATFNLKAEDNGEWVDLGLSSGTLWASKNIGASAPQESGNYYGWGDVTGKKIQNSALAFGPSSYNGAPTSTENTYGTTYYWHCCQTDSRYYDYDIAKYQLGDMWTMPTPDQIKELIDNTNHQRTTLEGVHGYKFTSKTDNSKWIFIPSAGYRSANNGTIQDNGYMYVWSSEIHWYQERLVGGNYNQYNYVKRGIAFTDYLSSGSKLQYGVMHPQYGFPVRPVRK